MRYAHVFVPLPPAPLPKKTYTLTGNIYNLCSYQLVLFHFLLRILFFLVRKIDSYSSCPKDIHFFLNTLYFVQVQWGWWKTKYRKYLCWWLCVGRHGCWDTRLHICTPGIVEVSNFIYLLKSNLFGLGCLFPLVIN